ncbi:MAG: DNA-binding response regulator [Chloroflexi bacterium]|nr:MAG: DNA-binding response regulator [Chloroflexota bacterium]
MNKKILVVDDDTGLLTLLQLGLEREGFTVVTADNGKDGLRRAYETRPDVVILDIAMPGMDGWQVCQRLRNMCDTPIIMLTARSDQKDVLKGFSLGVDDYLTKPCSFEELKARIYTVLRRARAGSDDTWRDVYDDGILRIDLKDGTVARQGQVLNLTPTESRLLLCLVGRKGQIVPHRELLVSVWGPEYAEEVGYLSVYIRYLRRKVEDDPSNPRYIHTRWGVGYYFAGNGILQSERNGIAYGVERA